MPPLKMKAMANDTLHITLTGALKSYVEERVAAGASASPEVFVHDLIARDRRQVRAQIEAELLAAQHSGEIATAATWLEGHTVVSTLREKLERK